MDMKVDSQRIREERLRRAWSQDHLAQVSGLGLRTVQRIESSGAASHESIAALASVLEVPVAELLSPAPGNNSLFDVIQSKRLSLMLALFLIASIFSPPNLTLALAVSAVLWLALEVTANLAKRKAHT
jgi:transcriptional regulator with XRE-family HTH domain